MRKKKRNGSKEIDSENEREQFRPFSLGQTTTSKGRATEDSRPLHVVDGGPPRVTTASLSLPLLPQPPEPPPFWG